MGRVGGWSKHAFFPWDQLYLIPCYRFSQVLLDDDKTRLCMGEGSMSLDRVLDSPFNPSVGFGSEADMLPFSAQFDRARTSELARNHSAGPRTSDPGKRTFQ
ncbi:hypothetical protein V6N13_144483 [Hibiscus sabdariffa]